SADPHDDTPPPILTESARIPTRMLSSLRSKPEDARELNVIEVWRPSRSAPAVTSGRSLIVGLPESSWGTVDLPARSRGVGSVCVVPPHTPHLVRRAARCHSATDSDRIGENSNKNAL